MSKEIHIGKLIRNKLNEEGRSPTWLAGKIPCTKKYIYKILEKSDIHPKQLQRISIVMKFDFFAYYSETVRNEI